MSHVDVPLVVYSEHGDPEVLKGDMAVAVDPVGQHPGHRANDQERYGAHSGRNAYQKGRAGDFPNYPGDGNLLKPTGRGIAQVAQPK